MFLVIPLYLNSPSSMFEASIVPHLISMLTKTYVFVDETPLAAKAIDEHGDCCYFAINEQSKLLQYAS